MLMFRLPVWNEILLADKYSYSTFYFLHLLRFVIMDQSEENIKFQERMVKVNGGQIYSEIWYTTQNRNKTCIIFLQGGPGATLYTMKHSFKQLANQFPVIFYDQLGSGSHRKLYPNILKSQLWTIENYVHQLRSVVQIYGLKRFILMGNSWGATLAIQYYFSSQTEVKPIGLVLSSPFISAKKWVQDANYLKQRMPEDIYKIMIECEAQNKTQSQQYMKAIQEFYKKHLLRRELITTDQSNDFDKQMQFFNFEAYLHINGPSQFFINGSLSSYEKADLLQKIQVPVLFTCGQYDQIRVETIEYFSKEVKSSRLKILEGCSHLHYFEDSKAYRQILVNFYKEIVKNE